MGVSAVLLRIRSLEENNQRPSVRAEMRVSMKLLPALFAVLILLSGCRTTSNRPGYDVNRPQSAANDPELRRTGDRILDAIQKEDYREFSAAANGEGMKITEQEFLESERNIRNQFGKITRYEYLADLEIPMFHNMIWKVRFERDGENQKTIRQELLFRLVAGKNNGKPCVVAMGFL